MLSVKNRFIAFVIIAVVHLTGQLVSNEWIIWMTRPLLMPSLLWWFLSQISKPFSFAHKRMIAALLLASAGDIFALLAKFNDWFFFADILCYLFMQLMYVLIFLSIVRFQDVSKVYISIAILIFIVYGIIFLNYLLPHSGWLTLPILIYASAVTLTIISSAITITYFPRPLFIMLMTGTIIYLISDTIIATNKFITPVYLSGFWGLLAYIVAQALITKVISKYKDETDNREN